MTGAMDNAHSQLQRFYDAAVRFVNFEREGMGRPPLIRLPRGILTDPCGCPVARGLDCGASTDGDRVFIGPLDHVGIELPPDVCSFIASFDEGLYPQLRAEVAS